MFYQPINQFSKERKNLKKVIKATFGRRRVFAFGNNFVIQTKKKKKTKKMNA